METIKLGIVEDQHLFREGIKALLSEHAEIEFIFESAEGYTVLERLKAAEQVPNVMLIDLTLPPNGNEEFNGWRVVEVLKQNYPEMGLLVLTVHNDEYLIAKLIEEGANGYLVKDSDSEEVYRAIKSIHEQGSYINQYSLKAIQGRLNGKVKTPKTDLPISKREIEVLRAICQQKTAEEIGQDLFISSKTVNGHRNNLLQKTGSRNMTGLVMYAIKHKLVEVM